VSENRSKRRGNAALTRRQLGLGGLALAGLAAKASASQVAEGAAGALQRPLWRGEVLDCLRSYDGADGPGLSVAIAQAGTVLFRWGGGTADLDHARPITPDTRFHVASVSKQFTAFAIALLERDGRLSLSDDVRKHLPYVPDLGARITLDHLIHHTSGLRDQWSLLQLAGINMQSCITQREIINIVTRQHGLNFAPGSRFSYCNTGYTLLAEVVRAVSSKTLREFADEHIFKPLRMTNTFIYDDLSEIVPDRALCYERRRDGRWGYTRLNYETWGATSLHTTATDLAIWGGNFARPKVGDAALIKRVTSPAMLADGTPLPYAFGLQVGTRAGHAAVYHGGSDAGFRATFAHFSDTDLTVVVLANTPLEVAHIANRIADIALNPGPARLGERLRGKLGSPQWAIGALIGVYASPDGDLLTIEADGINARMRRSAHASQPLFFRADGSFDLGQPENLFYRAFLGKDGKIVELEEALNAGGPPSRYQRVLPTSPDVGKLQGIAGAYRSPELDTIYHFTVDNDKLIARTILNDDPITFIPSQKDSFVSDREFMSTIVIERDSGGEVNALVVNSGRIAGVNFERVSS
jgi:CubicO group peptidase (beta-lactamase class C family)